MPKPFMKSLSCLVLAAVAWGQTSPVMDEYHVKAACVTSLASFVEWPAAAFGSPEQAVGVCVLGTNPFGESLRDFAKGKIVSGRALSVRILADVRQTAGCHIVFVSPSEHLRLKSILETLRGQDVFSVGDTSDFIAEGGIVNLRIESGKVRLEVNEEAARQSHLRVSSRLLQLAKVVKR